MCLPTTRGYELCNRVWCPASLLGRAPVLPYPTCSRFRVDTIDEIVWFVDLTFRWGISLFLRDNPCNRSAYRRFKKSGWGWLFWGVRAVDGIIWVEWGRVVWSVIQWWFFRDWPSLGVVSAVRLCRYNSFYWYNG